MAQRTGEIIEWQLEFRQGISRLRVKLEDRSLEDVAIETSRLEGAGNWFGQAEGLAGLLGKHISFDTGLTPSGEIMLYVLVAK